MTLSLDAITIDCRDPAAVAEFWREALSLLPEGSDDDGDWVQLKSDKGFLLLFLKVPDDKQVKNRIHFDLLPDDQEREVERLEALGARRIDIGQGDKSWIVMADVEGNEFCVLRTRRP